MQFVQIMDILLKILPFSQFLSKLKHFTFSTQKNKLLKQIGSIHHKATDALLMNSPFRIRHSPGIRHLKLIPYWHTPKQNELDVNL